VFLGDTMNLLKAFLLKALSALLFALLSACVRYLGEQSVPLGQMVFFRAAFAIVPVLLIDAWRRELADVIRTERPLGHLLRGAISMAGMFLNFAALARLPLVDATAISFAAPLITVAFAARGSSASESVSTGGLRSPWALPASSSCCGLISTSRNTQPAVLRRSRPLSVWSAG
jgi:drug/metabolite transporter (DMT)-like permease